MDCKVKYFKRFGISWCKWYYKELLNHKIMNNENLAEWEPLADEVEEIRHGTSKINDLTSGIKRKQMHQKFL